MPKFGMFDTRASTTGQTKNVPIALSAQHLIPAFSGNRVTVK